MIRKVWVSIALLALSNLAFGKCAQKPYEVTGVVLDAEGSPAVGALVGVAWLERGSAHGPAMAITDEKGRYTIRFHFNTYSRSGWIVSDVCEGDLKELSLSAEDAAARSFEMRIPVGQNESIQVEPVYLGLRR